MQTKMMTKIALLAPTVLSMNQQISPRSRTAIQNAQNAEADYRNANNAVQEIQQFQTHMDNEAEAIFRDLKQMGADNVADLKAVFAAKNSLQKQLDAAIAARNQLQADKNQLKQHLGDAERDIVDLKRNIKSLEKRIASLNTHADNLKTAIAALKAEKAALQADAAAEKARLDGEIGLLQDALDQCTALIEAARTERDNVQQAMIELRRRFDAHTNKARRICSGQQNHANDVVRRNAQP